MAHPNLLFVVWDTARLDRTSLQPGGPDTTPELARLAESGRVFSDAIAAASTTTPSHASMFTGLLPLQHGANADHPRLDDAHTTLAERLRAAGYRTWAWSANPHVGAAENLVQGFETVEHPWQPAWRARAQRLAIAKAEPDARERQRPARPWALKSTGDLAPEGLARWLDARAPADATRPGTPARDTGRPETPAANAPRTDATGSVAPPFFAFVNFMEAHRPFIPPRELRERFLPPEWVERSYQADRDWRARWRHTFGLEDADPLDLAIVSATYDVALRELDRLLAQLLDVLRERALFDDTVVVVTADHGEHLGEHRRVDHQYSLYAELLRVPLVIHAPGRVEPGRDASPVSGIDLFPTLLQLAGLEVPPLASGARDLLAPIAGAAERARLAEYPAVFTRPFEWMRAERADFDDAPWNRTLRALLRGPYKLIRGSDGAVELYDLREDPREARDLSSEQPALRAELVAALEVRVAQFAANGSTGTAAAKRERSRMESLSEEERQMLIGLGYAVDEAEGAAPGFDAPTDGDAGGNQ